MAAMLIGAAAVLLVVLCVTVQWLIASGGIPRASLLVDRAEGQVVWTWGAGEGSQSIPVGPSPESGGILLALSEASGSVVVLINGEAVADFGYTRAAIVVHRGDLVEVEVNQGPLSGEAGVAQMEVEVADATPNIRAPLRGMRVQLSPGRTVIANIVI